MQRRCYGYTLLAFIAAGLLSFVWADATTESADRDRRIQQLYESAFGPEEGARRYEEWRRTKDLPLDDYLANPPVTPAPANPDDAAVATVPAADAPDVPDAPAPDAAPSTTELSVTPSAADAAIPATPIILPTDPPAAPVPMVTAALNTVPAASPPTMSAAPAAVSPPTPDEYRLGSNDHLSIAVWQWPDLTQGDVIIRPDGQISFPLVGDVTARGLTVKQLDQRLTEELSRYIRNPQVLVAITEFGGQKVVVLGEVRSPGVYLLGAAAASSATSINITNLQSVTDARATLLEVIAQAGGFTGAAKLKSIIILRGSQDQPDIQLVDIYGTTRGKVTTLAANIPIRHGDIVYVPKTVMTDVKEVINTLLPIINTVLDSFVGYDQLFFSERIFSEQGSED